MSFWSRPATTTALLALNALLLLVLVIQNGTRRGHPPMPPPMAMPMTAQTNLPGHTHPPMDPHTEGEGAGPAVIPTGENFDQAGMVFASLDCPESTGQSLSDPSCSGTEADRRRSTVRGLVAQQLSLRKIFDKIIETYGEKALTEQALEIRRSMRRTNP